MADVVVSARYLDIELGVARDAEFFAGFGYDPRIAASQLVFTAACNALHDFGCAGAKSKRAG